LHMTPLDLLQLEALHEKSAEEVRQREPDIAWVAAMNVEFHRLISKATRNALLQDFAGRIYDAVARFRHTAFHYPMRLGEVVGEHASLLAALRARDPDRAEHVARAHMQRALDVRLRIYRESQHKDAGAGVRHPSAPSTLMATDSPRRDPTLRPGDE